MKKFLLILCISLVAIFGCGKEKEPITDTIAMEVETVGKMDTEQSEMVEDETIIEDTVSDNDIEQSTEIAETMEIQQIVEYEVLEINPEDMYASQNVNLRNGPNAQDFDKIGGLSYGDKVTVVGIVKQYKDETCLWYELSTGEFVSGAYLLKELPKQEVANSGNQGGNQNQGGSQSGNSGQTQQAPQQSQPSGNTGHAGLDAFIKNNAGSGSGSIPFTGQASANAGGAAAGVILN